MPASATHALKSERTQIAWPLHITRMMWVFMTCLILSRERSRHFSDSSHSCFCQTSATCLWFSYEEFLNGIRPIVNGFLPVTSDLTKGDGGKAEGKNGYGACVFEYIEKAHLRKIDPVYLFFLSVCLFLSATYLPRAKQG